MLSIFGITACTGNTELEMVSRLILVIFNEMFMNEFYITVSLPRYKWWLKIATHSAVCVKVWLTKYCTRKYLKYVDFWVILWLPAPVKKCWNDFFNNPTTQQRLANCSNGWTVTRTFMCFLKSLTLHKYSDTVSWPLDQTRKPRKFLC